MRVAEANLQPSARKVAAKPRRNVIAKASPRLFSRIHRDGLLTFNELTPTQQRLFGRSGAATYNRLSTEQRAVFLLLTRRMARAGVDFGGLRLKNPLKTIRRNRLLFAPNTQGLNALRQSLEQGTRKGTFYVNTPFEPFHPGMADYGVRQDRFKWTLQLGLGEDGAFVDVDRYNYKDGILGYLGHTAELIDPRRPDPLEIARELREDLRTKRR